jgi:periplasmic protein TonB
MMSDDAPSDAPREWRPVASAATARPAWLRPAAIGVALGVHAAILFGFIAFVVDKPTPLEDMRVELVPQGETVTETSVSPTPDAARTFALDPTLSASPDPTLREDPDVAKPKENARAETADLLSAPLPQTEAPDAPPVAVEQPPIENAQKSWRRVEEKKRKEKMEEARRQAAQRVARQEQARARQQAAHAQSGAAGVREGEGDAPRMSNAAYAALVSAEINRHKHYPPSARERGATGSVGVVFSIGPSGAVASHAITRSSGNGAIDAAVHQMLAVSHPPPPPGGFFRGSVTISFDLSR